MGDAIAAVINAEHDLKVIGVGPRGVSAMRKLHGEWLGGSDLLIQGILLLDSPFSRFFQR